MGVEKYPDDRYGFIYHTYLTLYCSDPLLRGESDDVCALRRHVSSAMNDTGMFLRLELLCILALTMTSPNSYPRITSLLFFTSQIHIVIDVARAHTSRALTSPLSPRAISSPLSLSLTTIPNVPQRPVLPFPGIDVWLYAPVSLSA
jgi:hypothetical protein